MLSAKPDPQLLLIAEIISSRRAPSDVPVADWPALIQMAIKQNVGPILWHTIKSPGFSFEHAEHWQTLAQVARQTAAQYALIESAQQQVEKVLTQVDIPTIWLKGIALAQTVYPDPTYRPMGDLDVLIPFQSKERALEIVKSLGYDFRRDDDLPFDSDDPIITLLSPHYHLVGGPAHTLVLELHYRLLSLVDLSLENLGWFWQHRQTVETNAHNFQALTPEAHLLYLCGHAELQHGELEFQLLRYFDIHLLITRSNLDWNIVLDQAVFLRWTYALLRALTLSQLFFFTRIPDNILSRLEKEARHDKLAIFRVEKLQKPGSLSEKLLSRLSQLPLRHKVRYLRSLIFPSPKYLRTRYALAPDQSVWPSYIKRWKHFFRDANGSIRTRLNRRIEK